MEQSKKYWVWYSLLNSVSKNKRNHLIEKYKTPNTIWSLDEIELAKNKQLSSDDIQQILDYETRNRLDSYIEDLIKKKINIVTFNDYNYPELLKYIYDPPIILYVKGNLMENENCIGIVGSRKASSYGIEMSKKLARELSNYDITIISGMARGIDSIAHKASIEAKGRTIAVLGCGLDIVYPPENFRLEEEIIQNGAVISEYPIGTKPLQWNFPERNRIISGISKGIIVVEAREKSGSLITAKYALEQGRDVFAVPGNANAYCSIGTNKLIKDGAKLVTSAEDVLEDISWFDDIKEFKIKNYENIYKGLDVNEIRIIESLRIENRNIEGIKKETGYNIDFLQAILLSLELKNIIKKDLSGNYFLIF